MSTTAPEIDRDLTVYEAPPPEGDWAQEPKVSHSEIMLYGEYAGVVRLLGDAAVKLADAYSLACKHGRNSKTDEQAHVRNKISQEAWNLYSEARRIFNNTSMATSRDNDERFRGYAEPFDQAPGDHSTNLEVNFGGPVA